MINSTNIDAMLSIGIGLPEVLILDSENIPIELHLRNNSKEDYKVSSLKYWSNVLIGLKREGQDVPGIKVKPNLANRNEYILVKSGTKEIEEFNFYLDGIFSELISGEYELTVRFIGNIIDEDQKTISYSSIETFIRFKIIEPH